MHMHSPAASPGQRDCLHNNSERVCLQASEPCTPTVRDVNAGTPFGLHQATSDSSDVSRMSQHAASAQPSSPAAAHAASGAAGQDSPSAGSFSGLPGSLPADAAPTPAFNSSDPGVQCGPPAAGGSAPVPPFEQQEHSGWSQVSGRRAAPDRSFGSSTGRPSAAQGHLPGSGCSSSGNSRPTAATRAAPVAGPGAAAAASGRSRESPPRGANPEGNPPRAAKPQGNPPCGAKPQGKGPTSPTTRPRDGNTGGQRQSAPASGGRQSQAERAQQANLLALAAEKQRRAVLLDQEKAEKQKGSAGDRRSDTGCAVLPGEQKAEQQKRSAGGGRSDSGRAADPAVQAAREVPQQPVTQGDAAEVQPAAPEPCKQPRAMAPRQQARPAAAEARPDSENKKQTTKQKAKEKAAAKAAREAKARTAKVQERNEKAAAALKAAQEAEAAAPAALAWEEMHSAAAVATAAAEAAQEGHADATPQPPVHTCAGQAAQEGSVAAEQAQMEFSADGHGQEATAQAQPVAAAGTAAVEPEEQAILQVQPHAEAAARPGQSGQQPAAAQPQCTPGAAAAASPAVGGTQPAAAVGRPQVKGLEGRGPQSATAEHPSGQARKAGQREVGVTAIATPAGDRLQSAAAVAQQETEEGLPQAEGLKGQGAHSGSTQQASAEHPRCRAKKAAQREASAAAVATPAGDRQQPAAAKAELPAGAAAHGGQPAAAVAHQETEENLPQADGLEGQALRSERALIATTEDRRCPAEEAAQPEAVAAAVATPAGDRQRSAAAVAQQAAEEGLEGQGAQSGSAQQAPAEHPRCRAEQAARQQVTEQVSRCSAAAEATRKERTHAAAHAGGWEPSGQRGRAARKTKPRPEARGRGKAAQTEEQGTVLDR